MAERVYLEWTIENWITVLLMVFVGMFAIGLISSAIRTWRGTASPSHVAAPSTATAAGGGGG